MPDTSIDTLVLKDGEGTYFLVPLEALERGRVPAERAHEVERMLAESAGARADGQDDVQGHLLPLLGLVVCFEVGMIAGAIIADQAQTDGGSSGHSGGQQQQIEAIVQNAQSIVSGGGRGRP